MTQRGCCLNVQCIVALLNDRRGGGEDICLSLLIDFLYPSPASCQIWMFASVFFVICRDSGLVVQSWQESADILPVRRIQLRWMSWDIGGSGGIHAVSCIYRAIAAEGAEHRRMWVFSHMELPTMLFSINFEPLVLWLLLLQFYLSDSVTLVLISARTGWNKLPYHLKRLLCAGFVWTRLWHFCTKEQIEVRGITWVHTKHPRLAQYTFLFAPATLETKDGMTTKAIQEKRLNLTNIRSVFLWGNSYYFRMVFQVLV